MSVIILAGGRSKRMGQAKADLQLGKKSLLEHVITAVGEDFGEVLVVARQAPRTAPASVRLVSDEPAGFGPLAGLAAGLRASKDEKNLVTACDTPFLRRELLAALLKLAEGWQAVAPETADGLHPLCAVYSQDCLPAIEPLLQAGERRMTALFPLIQLRLVGEAELRRFDPDLISLFNINTPEDLRRAEELLVLQGKVG